MINFRSVSFPQAALVVSLAGLCFFPVVAWAIATLVAGSLIGLSQYLAFQGRSMERITKVQAAELADRIVAQDQLIEELGERLAKLEFNYQE